MRIKITTTAREDEEILSVIPVWVDDKKLWDIIKDIYQKHNTVRMVIEK